MPNQTVATGTSAMAGMGRKRRIIGERMNLDGLQAPGQQSHQDACGTSQHEPDQASREAEAKVGEEHASFQQAQARLEGVTRRREQAPRHRAAANDELPHQQEQRNGRTPLHDELHACPQPSPQDRTQPGAVAVPGPVGGLVLSVSFRC